MAGTGVVTASLDTPFLALGTVERDLRLAERQLRAEPYAGKGVLPVVIAPDCFEALLGSLLGNFCGDEAILSGTSAWKDKLGTRVADPRLTVTIAARAPELVPAEYWTAEGFPAENYDVIHEGKLGSFLISQYVANRTGLARAKNSGGAFVVAPGEKSLDELMAAIGTGLYVGRFSGGAPASNGDFSGVFYPYGQVAAYTGLPGASFELDEDDLCRWYSDGHDAFYITGSYTLHEDGLAYRQDGPVYAAGFDPVDYDPAEDWGENWMNNWG